MRNKIIAAVFIIAVAVASVHLGNAIVGSPDLGLAILVGLLPASICVWIIIKRKTDRVFLLKLFLVALVIRWAVAYIIYSRKMQSFFGADAATYDSIGDTISRVWQGTLQLAPAYMESYMSTGKSGWGMYYLVAAIYYLIGHNPMAIQLINCALGAAACIAVYKVAMLVYPQQRVARTAALLTALSPSMILWSSQLLKDAPIVLALSLCALYTLKLREKFSIKSLLILLALLLCLFTLRHYAFYIMFVAIAGSFLVTMKKFTPLQILQGGLIVVFISVALAYFGAGNVPQEAFDLKRIQMARAWGAKVANTGFGGDVDITDPEAAISFLPVGLFYVLFAPFPWMITNLRQLITLPELICWWALVPMVMKGYWHAIRHRLKESFAICVFTVGLTLAYALYQSNVGTAYRHRAQLYVFFFVFISIGLELRRNAKQKKRGGAALARATPAPAAAGTSKLAGNPIGPELRNLKA
ncbi:MAG TPA: glycosyltransferase family 39 protein [Blastocatellia bacterium]|nr:glycosyltransferase family 39 protein [Blastocatellia bacterium]